MVSNRTFAELSREYKPAVMGENKPCDLPCCCSTCMYCLLPADEEHRYDAFCGRCRKED